MEEFFKSIADLGFPIVVSAYLLIRIESKLDKLSLSISQLATIISVKLNSNDSNKAA